MNLRDILPMSAKDTATSAMRWLQSFTDAYQSGVLRPGEWLTEEEIDELDREMSLFITSLLPRLHASYGTNPKHKASDHLHCLRLEDEVGDE